MSESREQYRKLCEKGADIPIFNQAWWLDAVCGKDHWDVLLVRNDHEIVASSPFCKTNKFGFKLIMQPKLMPFMGIWIKYPENQKYETKLSYEKKVLTELFDQLPYFDFFYQDLHYSVTNWLPLYWRNYKQTNLFTYVIEDLSDLDNVYNNFSSPKKRNIKKAKTILKIKHDLSAKDFFENHKMTLRKQNKDIGYPFELFERMYTAGYENNSAKTFYAIDENNNIHGALFIVWDQNSAYDLISTFDPDFRNSGASSLLVWETIKYVSSRTKMFDFEGSIIEPVAESFRKFGAIQKPYHRIYKANSWLIKLALLVIKIENGKISWK